MMRNKKKTTITIKHKGVNKLGLATVSIGVILMMLGIQSIYGIDIGVIVFTIVILLTTFDIDIPTFRKLFNKFLIRR